MPFFYKLLKAILSQVSFLSYYKPIAPQRQLLFSIKTAKIDGIFYQLLRILFAPDRLNAAYRAIRQNIAAHQNAIAL